MTLQQLEYILAVDTYRHFAKAAERCRVTQPTLSMMVQKLEDELGVKLFDRNAQPIRPTPTGKKVIEQADSLKLDGYTAETMETLKQALVKAKELMAREDLSPEDQAEVDAAVKELKAAIDGLKPAAAGDGKDDGTTVNQPGKTGDSAPVAIWLGAALLALFAGAAVTLKMKRKA